MSQVSAIGDAPRGATDHWARLAAVWNNLGPPLRPCLADVRQFESIIAAARTQRSHRLHALLLGVTPEIVSMRWPGGTRLTAVERSRDMLEHVWPAATGPAGAVARLSDWRSLPLPDSSIDVVIGDGCFTQLAFPGDYRTIVSEVARVLRPNGRFVHRYFVAPPMAEPVHQVLADLAKRRLQSFHTFKWRLITAHQRDAATGVRLGDVWQTWRDVLHTDPALMQAMNWPETVVATIDCYREVDRRYSVPTLAEVRSVLMPRFIELECHAGGYEFGDRFPIITFVVRESPVRRATEAR